MNKKALLFYNKNLSNLMQAKIIDKLCKKINLKTSVYVGTGSFRTCICSDCRMVKFYMEKGYYLIAGFYDNNYGLRFRNKSEWQSILVFLGPNYSFDERLGYLFYKNE